MDDFLLHDSGLGNDLPNPAKVRIEKHDTLLPTKDEPVQSVSGETALLNVKVKSPASGNWLDGTMKIPRSYGLQAGIEREIKILNKLILEEQSTMKKGHLNAFTVELLGSLIWDGVLTLVFNGTINGNSLHDCLCRSPCKTAVEIVSVAAPVLDALFYLHMRGIIVCNLSCETIIFQDQRFKINDLSKACLIGEEVSPGHNFFVQETSVLFNHFFLAPEIFSKGTISTKTDVYAFGVVLWEIWFTHPNDKLNPDTRDDMYIQKRTESLNNREPLLLSKRCMGKNPASRPQLGDVREELYSFFPNNLKALAFEARPNKSHFDEFAPFPSNAITSGLPHQSAPIPTSEDYKRAYKEILMLLAEFGLKPIRLNLPNSNYSQLAKTLDRGETVFVKRNRKLKIEHLYKELAIQAQLKLHENVIRLLGVYVDQITASISPVYEYADLGDLYNYLHKSDKTAKLGSPTKQPLSTEIVLSFLTDILKGIEALHRDFRLAHRDLKSPNVVLFTNPQKSPDGTPKPPICKLADFDLSKKINCDDAYGTKCEHTGTLCGTYRWMSPELLNPNHYYKEVRYDHYKVDMYAFGCIIWELIFRETPWKEFPDMNSIMDTLKSGRMHTLLHTKSWGDVLSIFPDFESDLVFTPKLITKGRKEPDKKSFVLPSDKIKDAKSSCIQETKPLLESRDFVRLLTSCLNPNPEMRPSASDALRQIDLIRSRLLSL